MNLRVGKETYKVRFIVDEYLPGCPRVRLVSTRNIPIATLSAYSEKPNGKDCFWLKDYSENRDIAGNLLTRGYLEETGRGCRAGYVDVGEVRFTALALAEVEDLRKAPECV